MRIADLRLCVFSCGSLCKGTLGSIAIYSKAKNVRHMTVELQ